MLRNLAKAVAIMFVILLAGAGPTLAAGQAAKVDASGFVRRLSSRDLARWRGLTVRQQEQLLTLLADPRVERGFATLAEAKNVSDSIALVESRGASRAIAPTSAFSATTAYEVHSWYSRVWTIFGIAYTRTRLDYYYVTGSGVVLYDHYCSASYFNLIPLRSVSVQVNHWVGSGKGTCVATWTITKLSFWTDTSDQGMRVNGAGVEATWGP